MNEIDYKFVHKDFRINGFPIDRNRLIIFLIRFTLLLSPNDERTMSEG